MKIPDRLVGHVKYKETSFPFEFDSETFFLNLYPPTVLDKNNFSAKIEFFSGFNKASEKKHKWIPSIIIEGQTANQYKIVFNVQDSSSNYFGFIGYKVNWYFYYSAKLELDRINGFKLSGNEVNYFLAPEIVLKSDVCFDKAGTSIQKLSVCSTEQKSEYCGKYRIVPHVDAEMKVEAYASIHSNNAATPIDATSIFTTTFSAPVGLAVLLKAYKNASKFFKYITYRKNISLHRADVFIINEDGKRDYVGILEFPPPSKEESPQKVKKQIVNYSLLESRTAQIFTLLKNDVFGFNCICETTDDRHYYPASRIIMILAEFEREYRSIYGIDVGRSQEYIDVKNNVVNLIEEYRKSVQGKRKEYVKQLRKYVDDRDSSFKANIQNALNDCTSIIKPFVEAKYVGTYPSVVNGISTRMGVVRNGIAHSRLDLHLDAVHLCDIKIIEELVYAMRLKIILKNDKKIQQAICNLFGEKSSL